MPMTLPKNVYALKSTSGTGKPASARHCERLKRFLAAVQRDPQEFELLISNLRLEMQPLATSGLSSQSAESEKTAKPCLVTSNGPGQRTVVSL